MLIGWRDYMNKKLVIKCANPSCNKEVDALHMDDDGYCDDCHNERIDGMVIEESEETRFLSDDSLRIMCSHPVKIRRSSRSSINFGKNSYK
jgi:hypothetical protein